MNNELKIFNNEEFGQIRTVKFGSKVLFAASDVAKALGYSNPRDAVLRHCKGVVKHDILTEGGKQIISVVPEGDVYRLITKSKLPSAEKFESWVFDEVLPTIRKTGGYVNNEDSFVETYLPFADENTRVLFKLHLGTIRQQNELIKKQQVELDYKDNVIIGLVDEITLAEKRQILNRVVRHKGKGEGYGDRWNLLYREFDNKYHINTNTKYENYNKNNKPKCKNRLDYIDIVMNKVPELYEIAAKLFESDVKKLVDEMYSITNK